MDFAANDPRKSVDRHRESLLAPKARVEARVEQQLNESLISTFYDYCTDCPDDPPCASNDPAWRQHLARQHEHLASMRLAIKERLKSLTS